MPDWIYSPLFGLCVYLVVFSTFRGLLGVSTKNDLSISFHSFVVSVALITAILLLHLGKV